jgi:membrane-associated PAP2 superfamily phosphatase
VRSDLPAPLAVPTSPGWVADTAWKQDAAVCLVALLALLAWDASGADLRVVQWFATPAGFPWRDHWLTAQVLHLGGRWLSYVAMAIVVVNVFRPFRFAKAMPFNVRWWWLVTTVVCLLLIPFIKSRSHVSCPWDLAQFGGTARYLSHNTWLAWTAPGDGGPGRCFPSGHASGAFSFLAGWFALRGSARKAARVWLVTLLAVGALFGLAQLARGAHYASHTMWTAWICWTVSAVCWHAARPLFQAPRADEGARTG